MPPPHLPLLFAQALGASGLLDLQALQQPSSEHVFSGVVQIFDCVVNS